MAHELDPATEEAIGWMVRLRSGRTTPDDHEGFERWCARNDRNAQAWGRLQRTVDKPYADLRAVDARLPGHAREARELLLQPSRRTLLRGLMIAASAGGALLLAERLQPWGDVMADLATGTGERRRFTLDDGSAVTLNARSSVDVSFDTNGRRLRLRQGDIVVQVARDPARPFVVTTEQGTVRALGTRFVVRQEEGRTRVTVQEHSVEVGMPTGQRVTLREGEGAVFDGRGIVRLDGPQDADTDWMQGLLVVNRQPLSFVVGELQRYRGGLLRVSPSVADLPVQGVFSLADVDRSLAALSDTLPIAVTNYGPWLTTIAAR